MRRLGTSVATVVVAAIVLVTCSEDRGASGPSVTFATTPPTTAATTTAATTTAATTTAAPTTGSPATDAPPTDVPSTDAPAEPTSTAPLGDPVIALEVVATVERPVDLAWRAEDDTLYVVGQNGVVVPLRYGTIGAPVLDVTALTDAGGERGLLGLTFSPDGALAYVNHTDVDDDTVIAEYAVGTDGVFDPASRRVLLTIPQPRRNHNGGNVMIGPDGFLYIGTGDGGSAGDPQRRSLDVSELLGKILRIDPKADGDDPYAVPADNPFVGVDGARPEVWSVGVRNPWRMSFDRATGDLWFGDAGQSLWEEIDVAWADEGAGWGRNFGWSAFEGTHRFNDDQPTDGATPPIYEYAHGDAGCAVSGGAVYRGNAIPALVGWYVFSDYCSGRVVGLHVVDKVLVGTLVLAQSITVSAVRDGPDGELYVLSLGGTVERIVGG